MSDAVGDPFLIAYKATLNPNFVSQRIHWTSASAGLQAIVP
jgi:hypothetical protein